MILSRQILRDFLSQLSFYTRLPLPAFREQPLARSVWAAPFVGALIGVLSALPGTALLHVGLMIQSSGSLFSQLDPMVAKLVLGALCAGLSLFTQIIVTGALHEDGWADCADSLCKPEPEIRWRITHDPHCGVFAVLSLVLLVMIRFVLFFVLAFLEALLWVLPVAFACARVVPILLAALFQHHPQSKTLTAIGTIHKGSLLFACMICFAAIIFILGWGYGLAFILFHDTIILILAFLMIRHFQGLGGDLLGATILLSEMITICAMVALPLSSRLLVLVY